MSTRTPITGSEPPPDALRHAPRDHSHRCAALSCNIRVARGMLMCRRHWFMLLPSMREHVWATWLDGAGVLSRGYLQAVSEAVEYIAEKEAPK